MFNLGQRSLSRLEDVHEDIRRVTMRAIGLTSVDFVVTQGRRTVEEQYELYGKGRTAEDLAKNKVPARYARPSERKVTWTIRSNHVLGRAVDLAPFVDGSVNYDNDGRLNLWPPIAQAMKQAAKELGVRIRWGGDWGSAKRDRPHFELAE